MEFKNISLTRLTPLDNNMPTNRRRGTVALLSKLLDNAQRVSSACFDVRRVGAGTLSHIREDSDEVLLHYF